MTEIRKQKLDTPKPQEHGQWQWLRREETPIKLLTPANEANTKLWRMVGRGAPTL